MKIRISVAAKEEGGHFWRIYLSQRSIICYKISRPLLKFWKHKCDRQQLFVEQNTSYPIKQSEKKKKKIHENKYQLLEIKRKMWPTNHRLNLLSLYKLMQCQFHSLEGFESSLKTNRLMRSLQKVSFRCYKTI